MNRANGMLKRLQSFLTRANGYVHGQVTSAPVDDPFMMQWYVSVMHLHDSFLLEFVHAERKTANPKSLSVEPIIYNTLLSGHLGFKVKKIGDMLDWGRLNDNCGGGGYLSFSLCSQEILSS